MVSPVADNERRGAVYTVTEYCMVPDCRCLDCSGVIIYDGDDMAKEAEKNARYEYVEVTYSPENS